MPIYYRIVLDPRDPDHDPEVGHPGIDELLDKQALVADELRQEEKTKC